jgi:hypothetical protein
LQDIQVGGEVDAPVRCAGGMLEVDDRFVVRVTGIERELDRAGELLVRSNLTKGLAIGDSKPAACTPRSRVRISSKKVASTCPPGPAEAGHYER